MHRITHPFFILLFVIATIQILSLPSFAGSKKSKVSPRDSIYYHHDFAPDPSDSVIQARIKALDSDIPFTFNPKVRRFIDYFSIENRNYVRMVLRRQEAYFPIFEEALKRHNMPDALKYLVVVESGINPKALSPATALGLWQFMPSTGKMYGLDYNFYIDERMDPFKATEAACKFLKQLYNMFHDWELALAAYNCGPGNVRKAIRRSGGYKNFWKIYRYLPRETRGYVPQFMALQYVLRCANEHNLYVEDPFYFPEYETVEVNQYFNLDLFADATNICVDELLLINPEIKRNVIPTSEPKYPLRIPKHIIPFYTANKDSINILVKTKGAEKRNYKGKEPSWSRDGKTRIVYRVKSGDVLGKIAQRYGVRTSDLRRWNKIGRNNVIRVGQKLYIYKPAKSIRSTSATIPSSPKTIPSSGIHVVKSGDTLWSISKTYQGLSVDKLKQINKLTSSSLSVGQKIKLK